MIEPNYDGQQEQDFADFKAELEDAYDEITSAIKTVLFFGNGDTRIIDGTDRIEAAVRKIQQNYLTLPR